MEGVSVQLSVIWFEAFWVLELVKLVLFVSLVEWVGLNRTN